MSLFVIVSFPCYEMLNSVDKSSLISSILCTSLGSMTLRLDSLIDSSDCERRRKFLLAFTSRQQKIRGKGIKKKAKQNSVVVRSSLFSVTPGRTFQQFRVGNRIFWGALLCFVHHRYEKILYLKQGSIGS